MKILFPSCRWIGGTLSFVEDAFKKLGHDVKVINIESEQEVLPLTYFLKLRQVKKLENIINKRVEDIYNKKIFEAFEEYKPDMFFSLNCYSLYPDTFKKIRESFKVITVSWVADNPFDSSRFKHFPCNLRYYDFLFLGDMIWEQNIRNVSPKSGVFHLVGAYSPDYFKPVELSKEDLEKYECNLAFAGTAYGEKAEGKYRAGVLEHVADLGLKIWGDNRWDITFKYYPGFANAFQGPRLNFTELNKMYQAAKINLNIPNPQCVNSFQQRTFEIAAAKGFQMVDYRKDIDEFFTEDEIVTFRNIGEFREKAQYFLKNPEKRSSYIEKAFLKMHDAHTYEHRLNEMFETVKAHS